MVDVNVDVEDSLVVVEERDNGEDNIIDVAEATCGLSLGVMEPAGPVDDNVVLLLVELVGSLQGSSCLMSTIRTEFVE